MNFSLNIGVKGLPQIGTWRKGGLMKKQRKPVAAVVLISVVVAAATSISNVNVNVTEVNFNVGNPSKAPPGAK